MKRRMDDKKTRTLESHKGAPPENSKSRKGLATRGGALHFQDSAFLASAIVIIRIIGSTGETVKPCRS